MLTHEVKVQCDEESKRDGGDKGEGDKAEQVDDLVRTVSTTIGEARHDAVAGFGREHLVNVLIGCDYHAKGG